MECFDVSKLYVECQIRMKHSIVDNLILWELRRFQMANGKEQMANGKPFEFCHLPFAF